MSMNKETIVCGLDLGVYRLKACLARVDHVHAPEIVGISQVATRGIRKSSISDLQDVSDGINRILNGLKEKSKLDFKDVHIGLGGHFIQHRKTHAIIPLADKGNKVITTFDIKKINHQACLLGINLDEKLIHDFPVQYVVDGFNMAANPLGLHGRKLEANILIAVAQSNLINNVHKAVQQAGFDVKTVAFSSLRSADACLADDDKKRGCIFIDMGVEATSVLIFKEGVLKNLGILNYGSNQLTEEISRKLNLPFDLAEDIKRSYAMVLTGDDSAMIKGEILVKRDASYVTIDRQSVCQVVTPWAMTLVEKIHQLVRQADLEHHLCAGIFVVGGGALLSGLLESMEQKFSVPTKVAKIQIETKQLNNPAVYAGCIGLAVQRATDGLPVPFSQVYKQGSMLHKVTYRLKELYQEYF
ncbi:MAG TPA: cell division protein FtsA [Candidatus Omnitrophota bacterium]|nr:cell division protein FtsA [Candidatus Omnitrophota bacterium]